MRDGDNLEFAINPPCGRLSFHLNSSAGLLPFSSLDVEKYTPGQIYGRPKDSKNVKSLHLYILPEVAAEAGEVARRGTATNIQMSEGLGL